MRFVFSWILFGVFLCSANGVCFADEPTPPKKLAVGKEVFNLSESANSVARSGLTFLAVLLFGFGVWRKIEQRRNPQKISPIQVLSRTPVGPRAVLLIVEVEGKRLLLSQTPDQLSLVTELKGENGSFQELLREEFAEVENG